MHACRSENLEELVLSGCRLGCGRLHPLRHSLIPLPFLKLYRVRLGLNGENLTLQTKLVSSHSTRGNYSRVPGGASSCVSQLSTGWGSTDPEGTGFPGLASVLSSSPLLFWGSYLLPAAPSPLRFRSGPSPSPPTCHIQEPILKSAGTWKKATQLFQFQ